MRTFMPCFSKNFPMFSVTFSSSLAFSSWRCSLFMFQSNPVNRNDARHIPVQVVAIKLDLQVRQSVGVDPFTKRLGNAVLRNRVKRRIREIFRREKSILGSRGVDLVVNARRRVEIIPWKELQEEFRICGVKIQKEMEPG